MSVYIVQARQSECGSPYGNSPKWGRPGDQLQEQGIEREEVERVALYGSFQIGFRWKNRDLAKRCAEWMKKVAAQAKIGYAQNNNETEYSKRTGLLYACRRHGWDVSKWAQNVPKCNCDCSSLQMAGMRYCDIDAPEDLYTGNQVAFMRACGAFEEFAVTSKTEYKVGDILWRSGHTVQVVEVDEPEEDKPVLSMTTTGNVYIREGAGVDNKAIGKAVDPNTRVRCALEYPWYKVTLDDGREGWMSGKYLK